MKLIIIYGPPAVGKLTVAKELAKITGFKVFHNHLTLDAVKSVLNPKHEEFSKILSDIRLKVIEASSKAKTDGIIFTSGYNGNSKDTTIEQMIKITKKQGGEAFLIHLICEEKELYRRVISKNRKKYSKTTTVKDLKKRLSKWKQGDYPNKTNLTIDNTKLTAKKTAKIIKEQFGL